MVVQFLFPFHVSHFFSSSGLIFSDIAVQIRVSPMLNSQRQVPRLDSICTVPFVLFWLATQYSVHLFHFSQSTSSIDTWLLLPLLPYFPFRRSSSIITLIRAGLEYAYAYKRIYISLCSGKESFRCKQNKPSTAVRYLLLQAIFITHSYSEINIRLSYTITQPTTATSHHEILQYCCCRRPRTGHGCPWPYADNVPNLHSS